MTPVEIHEACIEYVADFYAPDWYPFETGGFDAPLVDKKGGSPRAAAAALLRGPPAMAATRLLVPWARRVAACALCRCAPPLALAAPLSVLGAWLRGGSGRGKRRIPPPAGGGRRSVQNISIPAQRHHLPG